MRTPKTLGSAVFLCLSLLHPSPIFSARPLVVDDARTVGVGDVQFELGLVQSQPEKGGREQAWPAMALTYGLYKGLEVGLGIQRVNSDLKRERPVEGFEDLHLAAKYNLLPGEKYDFSFAFDLKVPTANRRKGLSSGRFGESLLVIATKHFFPAALDLNFGYIIVDSPPGEKLKDRFFGGVALRYGLNENWRLVGEIYGLSREASGAKNEANFQVGVRLRPNLPVFFDAAIGRSLLPSGTRIQGTLGITWTQKPDL